MDTGHWTGRTRDLSGIDSYIGNGTCRPSADVRLSICVVRQNRKRLYQHFGLRWRKICDRHFAQSFGDTLVEIGLLYSQSCLRVFKTTSRVTGP
jgi:hypothetical protein